MSLRLSKREREALEAVIRHQRGESRLYRRARMILLAHSGASKASIARQLGTNRTRVGEWLRRFEDERLSGLRDAERSGRPAKITALEPHQVIAAACRAPDERGVDRAIWTHDSLREALVSSGLVRECVFRAIVNTHFAPT